MIHAVALSKMTFAASYHEYTARDAALYAICAGMAVTDPERADELRYVIVSPDQPTLPTMVAAVAWDDQWVHQIGVDVLGVLHTAQTIRMHQPMPASARLLSRRRIGRVEDRGAERGAVISLISEIFDADTDTPLADTELFILARRDGGFSQSAVSPAQRPDDDPGRPPDLVDVTTTSRSLALQYRLLGDDNPLHAIPAAAARSGFARPILHGLCTLAIACKHVTSGALGGDARSIRSIEARFSGEVYPGDTLQTSVWKDGGELLFSTVALERGRSVLKGGRILTDEVWRCPHRAGADVPISGTDK